MKAELTQPATLNIIKKFATEVSYIQDQLRMLRYRCA